MTSVHDDDVFHGARYERRPRRSLAAQARPAALSTVDQALVHAAWQRARCSPQLHVSLSDPQALMAHRALLVRQRTRAGIEMPPAPDDSSSLYTLVAGVLIAVGVIAMLIVLSMLLHP